MMGRNEKPSTYGGIIVSGLRFCGQSGRVGEQANVSEPSGTQKRIDSIKKMGYGGSLDRRQVKSNQLRLTG